MLPTSLFELPPSPKAPTFAKGYGGQAVGRVEGRAVLRPSSSAFRFQVSVLRPSSSVLRLIDTRRSNGEQELSELAGETLLLPKAPAFYPDREAHAWRVRNLIA